MRASGWLCLGPILLCLLDGGLTLLGQPDGYWAGEFARATEWNPLGRRLLLLHPLAFALALLGWAGLVSAAALLLPARAARALTLLVQVGHTCGAATWLARLGGPGWVAVAALFVASRLLLDWSRRRA
jgi:hypothetical protein